MDVVSLNLQKTRGSPFHQTMEVSATQWPLWPGRCVSRVTALAPFPGGALFPQKNNLFVYKGLFGLPWMHKQTLGHCLCTHLCHLKQPLK